MSLSASYFSSSIGMSIFKCRVKCGSEFSEYFNIPLGTKQVGISSPGYFSLYVNDLVSELRQHGIGCHLIRLFLGCVLLADDLALMAPTRAALQKMVDICSSFMARNCLLFNTSKCKVMVFGKSYNDTSISPILSIMSL